MANVHHNHNDAGQAGLAWGLVFTSWMVAAVATAGSLFFSEVMGLPPCTLCWYQRILMYPLTLLFLVGLLPFDRGVARYAFPLVIFGWAIAVYHNLLYYGIIPESAAPCMQGVPCTAVQINWLGFITIPLLSLVAFSILMILLFTLRSVGKSAHD